MPPDAPGTLIAPQPVPPARAYSFTDWQIANPSAPPPGDRLDAEFDRANGAISDTIDWAATSLNTDGTLRTGTVSEAQLTPGLFDEIGAEAVEQVQPLVDQAGSLATQALNSSLSAQSYATLAGLNATTAGNFASGAATSNTTAQGAASSAQTSAATATNAAGQASNSANHADGAAATGQAYADVGKAWAEYMPDTIPPNILAVMGVTGNHWSSRWWAAQAAQALSAIQALVALAPPQAALYSYTYIAIAGQTVFTGADRDGHVLAYAPGPQQILVTYENGLLRTPVTDYTTSANQVTYTTPCAAGDVVQVWVEGVAPGQYLPLSGGTLTGPLILAADPVVALGAATKRYVDLGFLALSGGVLTGFLTLAANPTAALHAATKQYVDGRAPLGGPYLPLSGGTVAGPLTVNGALTLAAGPTADMHAATRLYVDNKLGGLFMATSNAGLPPGTLWNNGGFVCVA